MIVSDIVITCCHDDCGIAFAVPQWWYKGKQDTHAWFYCPNGHRQHFSQESEKEKMRRERDIARQQLARVEQEVAKAQRETLQAQKETKRLKKRAAMGICPCCHRTVSQMERHMKTKHPEFITENVVRMKEVK
jgi:hypothetical protein